jgi:hypothetical protein
LDHPGPVESAVGELILTVLFGDVVSEAPVGPRALPLMAADELQQSVPVSQIEVTTVEVGLYDVKMPPVPFTALASVVLPVGLLPVGRGP